MVAACGIVLIKYSKDVVVVVVVNVSTITGMITKFHNIQ